MSPTLDLTDFDDTETWSATGRDSGTGCNVGVLIVCWVSADIAQNIPETRFSIIKFSQLYIFYPQRYECLGLWVYVWFQTCNGIWQSFTTNWHRNLGLGREYFSILIKQKLPFMITVIFNPKLLTMSVLFVILLYYSWLL